MRVQDAVHVTWGWAGPVTFCGISTHGLLFAPIAADKVEAMFGTPTADRLCPLCVPLNEPW